MQVEPGKARFHLWRNAFTAEVWQEYVTKIQMADSGLQDH